MPMSQKTIQFKIYSLNSQKQNKFTKNIITHSFLFPVQKHDIIKILSNHFFLKLILHAHLPKRLLYIYIS